MNGSLLSWHWRQCRKVKKNNVNNNPRGKGCHICSNDTESRKNKGNGKKLSQ